MVLKLYVDLMSQPSRAVALFARANAIPCQEVAVALRKGEHRGEAYTKINPFQKVPAMEHDGFKLTESVAILKYLCRTFSVPEHWYPKNPMAQAKVDEYMAWQHLNMRSYGSMYFQSKVIQPLLTGEPAKPERVARYEAGLQTVLDQIENIWLKDNPYIAGKDLTIADLLAVTELEQPGMGGFVMTKQTRPIIISYMELVKSRLEPHYSDVHSIVYKMTQKFKELNQAKL